MFESGGPTQSCEHQLEELLGDPEFSKIIDLTAKEVMRSRRASREATRSFVLSAIGEPKALADIYDAWCSARATGGSLGLTKVIIRRRAIDLLRKEADPTGYALRSEERHIASTDWTLGVFDDSVQRDSRAQLELQQLIQRVRDALARFADRGMTQQRQAHLLRRHILDEVNYSDLSIELGCSQGALRMRVYKAMHALHRYVQEYHPELRDLLDTTLRDNEPEVTGTAMPSRE